MINTALSRILQDMADLLELDADNPFRIRAYRRAAETIANYPEDLTSFKREQLLEIPGIGKGIADLIVEFQTKGVSADYEKMKKKFPEGVLKVMSVQGLGAKRAAILYKELRIDSLAKLESAAKKGVLATLAGFGEKSQAKILKSLEFVQSNSKRMLITNARLNAAEILEHLKKERSIIELELAGSARRWRETVGDLDFLCTSRQPQRAIDRFLSYPHIQSTLASGTTKASVMLNNGLQVDFRVVAPNSFGAALLYFTGSKEHNVRLREIALKKGLSLNEYGVFKVSDTEHKKPLAGKTEQDVYAKLGMAWIPPELRENRGEIEAAIENRLPNLIEVKDVLGDFHNHTDRSDGANTLEQMTEAARAKGWKWFFTADHSPSLTVASGLTVEELHQKMKDVKALAEKFKGFSVGTSSEVDILVDGKLDYPDSVLAELDCVVSSVHSRFNQPIEQMTERICTAVKNQHTDILGHISGRLISKRDSYAVDVEAVLQTAKKSGAAIEINGQAERQELTDVHVRRAVELGIPLAVNTDAHSIKELEHMTLAVHIARRGWAESKNILNTRTFKEISSWLDR